MTEARHLNQTDTILEHSPEGLVNHLLKLTIQKVSADLFARVLRVLDEHVGLLIGDLLIHFFIDNVFSS